jgi:hypothetical protein
MGLRKHKRLYPKLSVFFRAFNVNVDRLLSLSTEEKEPVSMMTENFGHNVRLGASIRSASSRCANRQRAKRLQSLNQSFSLRAHRLGGIHGPLKAKASQRINNAKYALTIHKTDRLDAGSRLSL